jgi:hypothetical protein
MKFFTGWAVSAGLVLAAGAANAQMPAPHEIGEPGYAAVSDVDSPYGGGRYGGGPYAAMPPEAPGPGYGPSLLPAPEVYTILRENGFSPLGIPHQRGQFYTIAAVDRRGDDGRLVIDARNGRIVRFMPAYRMGDNFYGPAGPPPIGYTRGVPRPPASVPMPVPRMASRTPPVPLPQAPPPHAGEINPQAAKSADKPAVDKPAVDKPAGIEPAQQSAAVQAKPADTPAPPQAAVPIVAAKPAATIQPTQEMPKVQGLE